MSIKEIRKQCAYPPDATRRRYYPPRGSLWGLLIKVCPGIAELKTIDEDELRKLERGDHVEEDVIEYFASKTGHPAHQFHALDVLSLCVLEVKSVMPDDPIYNALKAYIIFDFLGALFPIGVPCEDLARHLRTSEEEVFRSLTSAEIEELLLALLTRGFVLKLANGKYVPQHSSMITDYELDLRINFRIATVEQTLTDILAPRHRTEHTNVIAAELKDLLTRCDELLPSDFNNLKRDTQEENLYKFASLESQCECARAANIGFLREQIQRGVTIGLRFFTEYLALATEVYGQDDAALRQVYKRMADKGREMIEHHRLWLKRLIDGAAVEELIKMDVEHARENYKFAKEISGLSAELR